MHFLQIRLLALILGSLLSSGCGSLLALRTEYVYPPQGEIVRTGDYDLHVLRRGGGAGQGQSVIYLHGSLGSVNDFTLSPAYSLAEKDYDLIVFDRPGSGYSSRGRFETLSPEDHAAVLHDLIAELQLERPILLAHSWGGAVALAHAVHYPAEAGALVLLSPAAYPWPGSATYPTNWIPPIPLLGDLFMETIFVPTAEMLESAALGAVFAPEPVPENYQKVAAALAKRPSQFIANSQDMSTLRPSLERLSPRYPEIKIPVFIVSGEQDRIVPPTLHARKLLGSIRGSRLILLPAVGHQPLFSSPEIVLEQINRAKSKIQN